MNTLPRASLFKRHSEISGDVYLGKRRFIRSLNFTHTHEAARDGCAEIKAGRRRYGLSVGWLLLLVNGRKSWSNLIDDLALLLPLMKPGGQIHTLFRSDFGFD